MCSTAVKVAVTAVKVAVTAVKVAISNFTPHKHWARGLSK